MRRRRVPTFAIERCLLYGCHDLRAGGETALRSAAALARRCSADLRLVYVIEPQHTYQRISHPLLPIRWRRSRRKAGQSLRRWRQAQNLPICKLSTRCEPAKHSLNSSSRAVPGRRILLWSDLLPRGLTFSAAQASESCQGHGTSHGGEEDS